MFKMLLDTISVSALCLGALYIWFEALDYGPIAVIIALIFLFRVAILINK